MLPLLLPPLPVWPELLPPEGGGLVGWPPLPLGGGLLGWPLLPLLLPLGGGLLGWPLLPPLPDGGWPELLGGGLLGWPLFGGWLP